MSNNNSGGSHDGDRGRQPNRSGSQGGNREKRRRSASTEAQDDNSSVRSADSRRDLHQNQLERFQNILQAHNIQGSATMGRSTVIQRYPLAFASTTQLQDRLRHAHPKAMWAHGEARPSMFANRITDRSGTRQHSSSGVSASRARVSVDYATEVAQILAEKARKLSGDRCAICGCTAHDTKMCSALLDPAPIKEREKSFKTWCPHHLSKSHSMDDCRQKWTWLRDPMCVTQRLVENCGAGPAFATDLIDWRCLLDTLPDTKRITVFPWTPEFAAAEKQREPDFHKRYDRATDPATATPEARSQITIWQTASGNEPLFKTYAALKAHSEREHLNFQQELERQLLAAKKEEEDARACEEFKKILIQLQACDKEIKALREKLADNPEMMQEIDRMEAAAGAENS